MKTLSVHPILSFQLRLEWWLIGFLLIALNQAQAADDHDVQQLIAKVRPSIATIRVSGRDHDQQGMGTGFVIDSEGLIATNLHVIGEGRSFTVEMSSGRTLRVVSVEASDRGNDLALLRVDIEDKPLRALQLAESSPPDQGLRVLAFGNPLGLRNSVVEGIVSAVREIEGREMIQLAMPIEPGNSGGPVVDLDGRVHGIVNLKSAIDENLGFAIPVGRLAVLRSQPNPITIDRWTNLLRINEALWQPRLGAKWQQRGGVISAPELGNGFGGRSLCLSTQPAPETPYDVAVMVRLDDESGAAGLAFCSDGGDRHYGFYPSNGGMRFTCFRGANVFSWQILHDSQSQHYLPGQWNRLRVRIEKDRFQCFVNEHLVVESFDQQLAQGRIGLVKFRNTKPRFKRFEIGADLGSAPLSEAAEVQIADFVARPNRIAAIGTSVIQELGNEGDAASRELLRRAMQLENDAKQLRKLASDVQLAPTLGQLEDLFSKSPNADSGDAPSPQRLLKGALLIAALDDADIDIEAYQRRIDEMATEIRERLQGEPDDTDRRDALNSYLFKENGFHGGRTEYYHRANSHLNRVIDDREGLPITLSILYMELGKRIGLQIDGVGLPGHFVVKHVVKHVGKDDSEQLIDVFDGGVLMSRSDANSTVTAALGRPLDDEDLRAQTTAEILTRVLRNLMGAAGSDRDSESLRRYSEALVAVNPESAEFRMMRAQFRGLTGRAAAAIEDLDWLLDNDPVGLDRRRAEQMRAALLDQP